MRGINFLYNEYHNNFRMLDIIDFAYRPHDDADFSKTASHPNVPTTNDDTFSFRRRDLESMI